ncbi:MAG: hypothetical protein COW32_08830 [Candidatus Aquicultor secundus]|nr:MAG: hypothetical protein COW32_08830 [Candidatus Aquicultor secundus]
MFNLPRCNLDILTEGMARITGALDVAFELLERYKNPTSYDPWLEKRDASTGRLGGNEARRQWQDANGYPLQHLRNYRNHLIHGRLTPGLIGTDFYVPKIGTESKYFDWRLITDQNNNPGLNTNDLSPACGVLRGAWDETLDYLESSWRSNLL